MNTNKKSRKPGSGGARPGAGRKPKSTAGPTRAVSFRLTPEAIEDMKVLRAHEVNVTRAIEREIHRLAIAYDLADLGIN